MKTYWRRVTSSLLILMAGLLTRPAIAGDLDTCTKETGDIAISACTRAIVSRKYTGQTLWKLYVWRGVAYANSDKRDLAIQDYDQAIKLLPGDATAFELRCSTRWVLGQLQAALADCNQALRLRPNMRGGFSSRGFVYIKLGRFDAAIADFSAVLKLDPKDTAALFGRSVAHRKRGDVAAAEADLAAINSLDGAGAANSIASYFAKLGISGSP